MATSRAREIIKERKSKRARSGIIVPMIKTGVCYNAHETTNHIVVCISVISLGVRDRGRGGLGIKLWGRSLATAAPYNGATIAHA